MRFGPLTGFQQNSSRAFLGAILALAAFLLYLPSLSGGFVYLDRLEVAENPVVQNVGLALHGFSAASTNATLAGRGYYYRPLYFLAFAAIDDFAGPQPWAFHLVQIAIFAATAWMVFLLGSELFADSWIAFFAALLWLAHPAHVEAVAWISSFCDVGCTFFCIAALLLFVRAEKSSPRHVVPHLLPAAAFLVALLFKEMAIALPAVFIAYWFFVAPKEAWSKRATRFSPYVIVFGVYLALRLRALGRLTASGDVMAFSTGLAARAITLLGVHTKIFVWPSSLTLARTVGYLRNSLFPWPVILFAALLAAWFIRKREPILSFLLFSWPLALLPALDVRQLTFPYAADRFSYLPSVFLCLAIAYAALSLAPRAWPRIVPNWLPAASCAALAIVWVSLAVRAIPHWHDDISLARYSISQSPEVPTFHCLLGRSIVFTGGDLASASLEFQSAVALSVGPTDVWRSAAQCAHMGLANVAESRGQLDEAARQYRLASLEMPANSQAYQALAQLYIRRGDMAGALQPLRKLTELNPGDLGARFNLGVCLMRLGRYPEAFSQFEAVDLADPNFPNILEAKEQARRQAPFPASEPQ